MNGTPPRVIYLYSGDGDGPETGHEGDGTQSPSPSVEEMIASDDVPPASAGQRPTDLYDIEQVEKLVDIPVKRLRRWSRAGIVRPSGRRGKRRCYTFQDLVALRAAASLLEGGLKERQLARALKALHRRLPHRTQPLSELRLSREGQTIVVREQDICFEAETGQVLLDFDVEELHKQVVELANPRKRPGTSQRQQAFDAYLEGCRLEADAGALDRAEEAYRQAIELDPELACAYTNLGNIRYRAGATSDARALYEQAVTIEPEQPEAQYNLAFLTYEEGELDEAVASFRRAIELDPDFADAHFNLAMALTELGLDQAAATHFAIYIELEPGGPWASLAHQELHRPRW